MTSGRKPTPQQDTGPTVRGANRTAKRSPVRFFLLVLALSVPAWALGATVTVRGLPLNLPVSAVAMTFIPLAAAVILVADEDGLASVRSLLARTLDAGERGAPSGI